MKQVTIDNVKKRILELERAGCQGLSISLNEERELDCLRQLVAVTEQRDALVVEAAALKSGDLFFSYGSEHGFEWHKTAKQAAENAEAAIDDYRGDACDGWSEEVSSICCGVIMQSSTMVGERPRTEDDRVDSAIDTICDYALLPAIETPATDAAIASLRAEGVEMFAKYIALYNSNAERHALSFAAQLRSQSAASPAIVPLPVERDQYGYWTHPAYDAFCDGREHIPSDEFNAWMKANGLEWTVVYRDEEEIDPAVDGYDISKWRPEAPAGNGWFVGSIHDTEDGAVCIWLRNKSEPSPEAAAIARQFEQVKGVQS